MLDLRVLHVGRYTHAQRTRYVTPAHYASFSLSGLLFQCRNGWRIEAPGPHLSLTPRGTTLDFAYDERRENWVIQFEGDFLRAGGEAPGVDWRQDGGWIPLPGTLAVSPARVPRWRDEFTRLREAFETGTPAGHLRVAAGVAGIVRELLDSRALSEDASPVARLKQALENDVAGRESLDVLSRRCGYAPDHLRRLFIARYGIAPGAYRNRRRLTLAMDLATGSRLSVKEIARATGFRHVSHLSSAFRQAYGVSPREAIRNARGG